MDYTKLFISNASKERGGNWSLTSRYLLASSFYKNINNIKKKYYRILEMKFCKSIIQTLKLIYLFVGEL